MNKFLIVATAVVLTSCNKIEEKINEQIDTATETAKQKVQEKVNETIDKTISESINSVTKSKDVVFTEVFPNAEMSGITEYKGKKFMFPNGSPAYFMKYKGDKAEVLTMLASQPTTDEAKSDKEARKIDGQKFIDQISLFEKFIPEGIIDTSFLTEIKTDDNIEFYRLNRLPNKSTLIFNPKNNTVYHFVEVK